MPGECACWVSTRPDVERFCIRWGAHSLTCPVYRESGDPVDRMHDEELRSYGEAEFGHKVFLTDREGEV